MKQRCKNNNHTGFLFHWSGKKSKVPLEALRQHIHTTFEWWHIENLFKIITYHLPYRHPYHEKKSWAHTNRPVPKMFT